MTFVETLDLAGTIAYAAVMSVILGIPVIVAGFFFLPFTLMVITSNVAVGVIMGTVLRTKLRRRHGRTLSRRSASIVIVVFWVAGIGIALVLPRSWPLQVIGAALQVACIVPIVRKLSAPGATDTGRYERFPRVRRPHPRAVRSILAAGLGCLVFLVLPSALAIWYGVTARRELRNDSTFGGGALAACGIGLGATQLSLVLALLVYWTFGSGG